MSIKPKRRLELDWSWLRSCIEMTPQEKRVLSLIAAIVLVGLAARHAWHQRLDQPSIPPPVEEEFEP